MSTKLGSMPVSASRIPLSVRSTKKLAFLPFPKVCKSCATGFPNTTVRMSAWNLPVSTESLFLIFWRRITSGLLFPIPNIPSLKRVAKQIVRMPGGFVIYTCVACMLKPSFIPPADIRELRDLVRYRFKLTCMITGEKNRAHNCLTVSNLKLDDVFFRYIWEIFSFYYRTDFG